jgi:menaquinol-cytochrome c reductase iron-sulfur subunit
MKVRDGLPAAANRRDFFKEVFAGIISAILVLIPAGAGLAVILDPLRRKSAASEAIRITSLEALPADGIPRKFAVVADRVDAWNKFPQVPVGAVYLRRTGDQNVEALNVVCPHAGGFVDYVPDKNCFICPLHDSKFALDGKISDPKSPAPRPMDTLPVEIRDGQIWVKFQNFQSGPPEKIPA